MPIIAVLGPTRERSSAASCAQIFSASGSGFTEILLQYQLRRDRVDRRFRLAAFQAPFGFDGTESFVDSRDRQAKRARELPREAFHPARERVLAPLRDRQPDRQAPWLPFAHQA